jgi:glutamine amidotransferase
MDIPVVLIDVGIGNIRSVHKALQSQGAQVTLTSDPQVVRSGERIVLPGVGAFGDYMSGLRAAGLDLALLEAVEAGIPLLGICVGMQALFEYGEELGVHRGLGLIRGRVRRLPALPGAKIPHTGWNQIEIRRPGRRPCRHPAALLHGFSGGEYAYFNHSYACQPELEQDILLETTFSASLADGPAAQQGRLFASGVWHENLYGVQFHPEKSQEVGLALLRNFINRC